MNDKENLYFLQAIDQNTPLEKGNEKIRELFDEMIETFFSDSPMKQLRMKALIIEFFYQFIECIKLENLAKKINLSPYYFKKKFKKYIK